MAKQEQDRSGEELSSNAPLEEQARDQTGQQRIRIRVDERNLKTSYANGVRPSATPEEVMLDFGMNQVLPVASQKAEREILFQANDRIILSYYAAKRLAMALTQLVRRYEAEYGEIELNSLKRRTGRRG